MYFHNGIRSFFMIPLGSQAGTVIIAKTIGANELQVGPSSFSVYLLGLWCSTNTFLIVFLVILYSSFLNSNDLNVETVAFYAEFFFVGCFFHLADSGQILLLHFKRRSRHKETLYYFFFSYWAIGIPAFIFFLKNIISRLRSLLRLTGFISLFHTFLRFLKN